jgi:hypothetical protein
MTFKESKKPRRRWIWWTLGTLGVVVLGLYLWVGPTLITAFRRGFFDQTPERTYTATQEGNLKAIYTALMSYHDSEGHFPGGSEWMDSIEHRLHAADLTPEEAEKKLLDPSVNSDRQPKKATNGSFGWAFNDAASNKYKDDVKDAKTTLLVFSSSDTRRNAHGSPSELLPKKPRPGGNLGITVSGAIVHLSKNQR